jgi:hypothetical protein
VVGAEHRTSQELHELARRAKEVLHEARERIERAPAENAEHLLGAAGAAERAAGQADRHAEDAAG